MYISKTRESAKRIMFKDILKVIDRKHSLKAKFNSSELSITLANGSIIYLVGADKDAEQMEKILGQKLKLVVIDEAAYFRQDLNKLVKEILEPAVIDYDGTICMISTTSDLTNSYYYHVTNDKPDGWEVHKWTAHDNPYVVENWEKKIRAMKKIDPNVAETPSFQRHFLNQWVVDLELLIYKYNPISNYIKELPKAEYNYVLGIDMGFEDSSAFVISAYSPHDPTMYIVETFKETQMIISDVVDKVNELNKIYNFEYQIVDGAAKQSVEEMKVKYGLPLIYAQKHGKKETVAMMNSDLINGKIKVMDAAEDLTKEWSDLIKDPKKWAEGVWMEHAGCENHLCDAALYSWRYMNNQCWTDEVKKPHPNSEAAIDAFWEKESKPREENDNDSPGFDDNIDRLLG